MNPNACACAACLAPALPAPPVVPAKLAALGIRTINPCPFDKFPPIDYKSPDWHGDLIARGVAYHGLPHDATFVNHQHSSLVITRSDGNGKHGGSVPALSWKMGQPGYLYPNPDRSHGSSVWLWMSEEEAGA